ncbi:unnamed protein product [Urochloa decumbens]|uniref:C3H1-type domain-containing protein n=1 Tax=Urochloa decumbens TaxID=240449 RepID=A0ABC9ACV2_9POAL
MQEALLSPANAGSLRSAFELKPFAFGDQRLASPRFLNLACGGAGDDALFRCSSPFSPSFGFSSPSPLATSSVSLSPSSSASLVDDCEDAAAAAAADAATGHRLQLARLALQYQEVADRYELCLARLADAADEAAALRRENAELRAANGDLTRRLALLSGIGKQAAAAAIADEVRRLRFGDQKKAAVPAAAKDRAPEKLAVLPKSISVRSNDYLKMHQTNQAPATPASNNRKPRASNPTKPSSRAYMGDGGGKKGEQEAKEEHAVGGMELEVYNQGMFKTELCNKWEETGACPYGDQCQFAHGVAELRPVIRHPRYKTQVCRMVLAGEVCPYGHRCHFRHSLTSAERLLVPRP